MGFLNGKKALIVGLASNRSIAYGIAKAFHEQGAQLAFTYQNEKLRERVETMAAEFGSSLTFPCDVASDQDIQAVFEQLSNQWNEIDIVIHSVAFAPADQISGDFVESVNREGFRIAHDISAYSLVALAKAALPMMTDTGSILTLSYYGAEKAVPNYNVMGIAKASLEASVRYLAASLGPKGIRVNAISAGPIKTLAAAGIKDFRKMQASYANSTPMRRNVTAEEVGNTAAFLCSDLASGITAEVIHVDAGYHAVSMSDLTE
ncbi:enoyl-[acyl-carrier-protein] reductase FabI [Legionella taurinensis]|uniref:Enoyl-[acyl-carrier-protein] reductase [NADH] n=1 Tax=Legionella taurinensis TaxID=70611 RepID=A0A3A5LC81_9GAMM|nr:enoyl-ACP reductase [Legionella taurinensis]MDX1836435.1 enoyl-ACP reductase [Legionella taurinensis]PUT43093.1 enoyl-[acyl-carrier-protein] reductase FabI [Legionella taurinensis]PUT45090.1 enoyl-[acyl-carrier-protein] reductase FabI [Legionella taurinensis]PUT45648.1 enoyl-[acyl-carrier-protein] reductase FabI [Legionella taurinensis]PUT49417.1 enoyl-[acyl-carrier-protein] reductase FabI [Legionella taurinensis]